MDYLDAIFWIGAGGFIIFITLAVWYRWLRMRNRGIRTTGVIVGLATPDRRSKVFEFVTADGAVIRSKSSLSAFYSSKVGTRIDITYHPDDPLESADRPGALFVACLLITPIGLMIGFAQLLYGIDLLP
ncbi:hypothetical protein E1293_07210 [Actinomadura darangshiensis]|uniref:DUF3592 domain-containing protein n=1 Tax=Actinomadura darangshiensis TaxID=705336 RepID=A0A4R5BPX3_9ACTN|nr:DUF3592 domain-containing protein [Actinomadura darangshiensis]TDD87999.1 hypothetical protein E1293_07210 [Actinomadura darangshiensis]